MRRPAAACASTPCSDGCSVTSLLVYSGIVAITPSCKYRCNCGNRVNTCTNETTRTGHVSYFGHRVVGVGLLLVACLGDQPLTLDHLQVQSTLRVAVPEQIESGAPLRKPTCRNGRLLLTHRFENLPFCLELLDLG